ncbi:hypothetical protein BDW67DRAFT_177523 [Aspergillus spinulosporus]
MPSSKHQFRQRKRRAFHPPPLFWAKLSKLWLTKSALREADRQNKLLYPNGSFFYFPRTFAPDFLRNCSAIRLQEIRRLSRCGGPDLSDIRNYPAPAHFCQYSMDLTNSCSERASTTHAKPKIGSTTVYDPHFEEHLTDHGVFPPLSRYPNGIKPSKPENFMEIQRRIRAPRPSLALSEGPLERQYEEFIELNNRAVDEQLVIKDILPVLEGKRNDGSKTGSGHPLRNHAHLTDGTLAYARPDVYHGAEPNQVESAIRKQLNDQIIPSNLSNRPVAPNFFVEAKGQHGSVPVAVRQACYYGALGARAMHSLQQYGEKTEKRYDNKAYVITVTYYSGYLGIYVTHPTRSRLKGNPDTDYVMTQVGQWALHGDPEAYRQGLNAYRNSRDLAKEFRDDFIRHANERYASDHIHVAGNSDGLSE